MFLDSLSPVAAQVGYGNLGLHGDLGYEGKSVAVGGKRYAHALSTHPPARLILKLPANFSGLRCEVAINDDVDGGRSHANFFIRADGRLRAMAAHVVSGEWPRTLVADVSGAESVELTVSTTRWEYCHAVWLDPQLDSAPAPVPPSTLVDSLGRAEITVPYPLPRAERCVATVVSPGFENLLDDMLGSLQANGGCRDTLLAVFAVDADAACERIVSKYGATMIRCRKLSPISVAVKSLLYSAARVIDAERFLCLDADMLVLDDLSPVFDAIRVFPEGSILVCREANYRGHTNLGTALRHTYRSNPHDLHRLLDQVNGESEYPLVVNDGLFAGTRASLLALDGVVRGMPRAAAWVDEGRHFCWWRNQFIFNLALARLRCGVELDDPCNIQLHTQDAVVCRANGKLLAWWQGRPVRVLHFCGWGRKKYAEHRGLFASGELR
jgi:NPCBM/NEW2 domain